MGIKSTYALTRDVALQCLAWYRVDGRGMTDQEIELELEEFEVSHFRNYSIEDEIDEDYRSIQSVAEFNNPAH